MDNLRPLTEQEYIDKLGLHCPNCHETAGVEVQGRVEVTDSVAWQNVSCSLCKADWADSYNLVGYIDLDLNEETSGV